MNATFQISGITLETERLILRPFEAADLNDFYEYASVEVLAKWQAGSTTKALKNRKRF